MIRVRLLFYVLFIALGAVILVRLLSIGLRWETASGLIFALAIISLGVYRIKLWSTYR